MVKIEVLNPHRYGVILPIYITESVIAKDRVFTPRFREVLFVANTRFFTLVDIVKKRVISVCVYHDIIISIVYGKASLL